MRSPAFTRRSYAVLATLSRSYPPSLGTFRCITHPFATRRQDCSRAAVRLACVRHAASVQSEPGSNSTVQSISSLNQESRISPYSSVERSNFSLEFPKSQTPTLIGCFLLMIELLSKRCCAKQRRTTFLHSIFSSSTPRCRSNFESSSVGVADLPAAPAAR